jgi:inorganic pyrophosphatase
MARCMETYGVPGKISTSFFSSYAAFLDMLDNSDSRNKLTKLRAADSREDSDFKRIKEISSVFEHCLDHIFFENEHVKPLTREYGIF